jgi:hypothetical protein
VGYLGHIGFSTRLQQFENGAARMQWAIRRIPVIMYVKMSIETRKSMSQTRKNMNKALLSNKLKPCLSLA